MKGTYTFDQFIYNLQIRRSKDDLDMQSAEAREIINQALPRNYQIIKVEHNSEYPKEESK